MTKELRYNIADFVLALSKDDINLALLELKKMSDYLCDMKRTKDIMNKPLINALKRVSYYECATMFGIENINRGIDETGFYQLMYEDIDDDDFDCLSNEYWDYDLVEEFEEIIIERLKENNNLCNLVLLPNNKMQEIPEKYWYELKVEELKKDGNEND